MATTQETALSTTPPTPWHKAKRGAKGEPVTVARFGSASVPVYRYTSGGRIRFVLRYHRESRRMRLFFGDLAAAKKEALLVAQRIQNGMQQRTDLKPHERESFLAARAKLGESGVPLVVAIEDYAQCRRLLGDIPLRQAVEDFCRRSNGVKPGVKVPLVVAEANRKGCARFRHIRRVGIFVLYATAGVSTGHPQNRIRLLRLVEEHPSAPFLGSRRLALRASQRGVMPEQAAAGTAEIRGVPAGFGRVRFTKPVPEE